MPLSPDEIVKLMEGHVAALKKFDRLTMADKPGVPEFSDGYVQAVDEAHQIRVHSDGVWPDQLIADKAPSETTEEFEYRRDVYQAVTMAPWDKIVASTSAIWHNAPLATDDDDANEYIGPQYPRYATLKGWLAEVARPMKATDPQGVVVVTMDLPTMERDGEIVVDDTVELEPYATLYRTEQVVEYVRGGYFVGLSSDRSEVRGNPKGGWVFVIVDEVAEYRYTQHGEFSNYAFELTELVIYPDGWDHMPAYQLGGLPTIAPGSSDVYQRSVFYNAVPFLNSAAVQHSNHDSVTFRCAFPTRVYYREDCGDCNGKGTVEDDECTTCGGSGVKRGFSPQRDYVHLPPGRFDPENAIPFPGLAYVSPDTGTMEFLETHIDRLIEKAGMAVNIDLTRKSGEPVTATEKRIDLQAHQRMLLDFERATKDLAQAVTDDIVALRYPDREIEVSVTRKSEFSIRGSDELLVEVGENAKAGMPQTVRVQHMREQVRIRFGGNAVVQRQFDVQAHSDALLGLTQTEIIPNIGRTIEPWRVTLHEQFAGILGEAMESDPRLLEKDNKDIRPVLEGLAQARTPGQGQSAEQIVGLSVA